MTVNKFDTTTIGIQAVRATEESAIAAFDWIGKGEEKSADKAAVDAMRRSLNHNSFSGYVVIGEGERDKSPMIHIGENIGDGNGAEVDIAVDPLEGTTLCSKNAPNSLSVLAIAERGSMLNAPDVYMNKLAAGAGIPNDLLHIDADPEVNIRSLADYLKRDISQIQVCILDRPRHKEIIKKVYDTGAKIKLIDDGDIIGVISAADPLIDDVDIYMGVGGAPEGVLASAALACIGGFFQGRLVFSNNDEWEKGKKYGITDKNRIYTVSDLSKGDLVFSATGVTDGQLLKGVRLLNNGFKTNSILMRSKTGTVRLLESFHKIKGKPWLKTNK